jgi:hypothetical protein
VSGSLSDRLANYTPGVALIRLFKDLGGNVNTYADKTGGLVLEGGGDRVEEKLAKLIDMLRHRYSFGYTSTNPQMDGKFRKIKLQVSPEVERREGGVIILTKKGYYARKRGK